MSSEGMIRVQEMKPFIATKDARYAEHGGWLELL